MSEMTTDRTGMIDATRRFRASMSNFTEEAAKLYDRHFSPFPLKQDIIGTFRSLVGEDKPRMDLGFKFWVPAAYLMYQRERARADYLRLLVRSCLLPDASEATIEASGLTRRELAKLVA